MKKYLVLVCLVLTVFALSPLEAKALTSFSPGNFAQVASKPNNGLSTDGLYTRSAICGTNTLSRHFTSEVGYIVSGNQTCSGSSYTWVKIRWTDGTEGWSAIADLNGTPWLNKITSSQCSATKSFVSGTTRVQVYGPASAYVRTEPSDLTKTSEAGVGTDGTVKSTSVCAIGQGSNQWANFWKVQFDNGLIGRVGEQVLFDLGTLKSQFVSPQTTPPQNIKGGSNAQVSIAMKNTGSETWRFSSTNPIQLGAVNDSKTWLSSARVELNSADAIATNAIKTFTFTVKAPPAPGYYDFQWQMVKKDIAWFGDKTPVVSVAVAPPFDPDFRVGEPVSIVKTDAVTSPLYVRSTACGTESSPPTEIYHATGTVVSGPVVCGSQNLRWWEIKWTDGKGGWSPDGYTSPWLSKWLVPNLQTDATFPAPAVLFLPGIMGSTLYERLSNNSNDLVWPPVPTKIYKLAIDYPNIRVGPLYTYEKFADFLNKEKGKSISDWQALPYDWRRSLNDIVSGTTAFTTRDPYILKDYVANYIRTHNNNVIIVAHSMGGLVAEKLISSLDSTSRSGIKKLITVGTPFMGTPDALESLLHGPNLLWFAGSIDNFLFRPVVRNMPGVYTLLPTAKYFSSKISYLNSNLSLLQGLDGDGFSVDKNPSKWPSDFGVNTDEAYIDSYTEMQSFILGTKGQRLEPSLIGLSSPILGNTNVLTNVIADGNFLDSWAPPTSMNLYEIGGTGKSTINRLDYFSETADGSPLTGPGSSLDTPLVLGHETLGINNGDQTVVFSSAVAKSGQNVFGYKYDLSGTSFTHPSLLNSVRLQSFLAGIFLGEPQTGDGITAYPLDASEGLFAPFDCGDRCEPVSEIISSYDTAIGPDSEIPQPIFDPNADATGSNYNSIFRGFVGWNSTINAGTVQHVTLQFENSGTETWNPTDGYELRPYNSDPNWTLPNVPLTTTVVGNVGARAYFNVDLIGAKPGGKYTLSWRMYKNGTGWFGETKTATITVWAVNDGAQTFSPIVSVGSPVEITDLGKEWSDGLIFYSSKCGSNVTTHKYNGSLGTIINGSYMCSGVRWWEYRSSDLNSTVLYVKDGTGAYPWLKVYDIAPSTKFAVNGKIKVTDVSSSLTKYLLSDPPKLDTQLATLTSGLTGSISGGPYYGATRYGTAGMYWYWKINLDNGKVGWVNEQTISVN